ncbi:endocuticle structural glycoprotein SgAbd-2 [Aethina tumida]|uniref:endocuticle structural glycoprotein SgAbd-2 n=1 Tax=Aethina tumida TaxID=116153 RepID=UPI00096B147F|nr:endocuticle structural glycoprotein SgAbd-2 [Aethina tumida]
MIRNVQVCCFLVVCAVIYVQALDGHSYHDYQEKYTEVETHHKKPIIPIIKQHFDRHHEGWQFSYETGNGIIAHENGYIKNKGDKHHETIIQQGKVTYHDEHGHPITLTYIADEHGFQAHGDHLPTPPPIPEAILKALHQNAQEPQEEHQQHAHTYVAQQQDEGYEHLYQQQREEQ